MDKKIDTHILIGNHDIYFKNTNSVNALQQLCTAPDGINEPWIYEEPKVVNFDGLDILMLPWINPENQQQSFDYVRYCKSRCLYGTPRFKWFLYAREHNTNTRI